MYSIVLSLKFPSSWWWFFDSCSGRPNMLFFLQKWGEGRSICSVWWTPWRCPVIKLPSSGLTRGDPTKQTQPGGEIPKPTSNRFEGNNSTGTKIKTSFWSCGKFLRLSVLFSFHESDTAVFLAKTSCTHYERCQIESNVIYSYLAHVFQVHVNYSH